MILLEQVFRLPDLPTGPGLPVLSDSGFWGFRPRLRRRDRDGLSPSSLSLPLRQVTPDIDDRKHFAVFQTNTSPLLSLKAVQRLFNSDDAVGNGSLIGGLYTAYMRVPGAVTANVRASGRSFQLECDSRRNRYGHRFAVPGGGLKLPL